MSKGRDYHFEIRLAHLTLHSDFMFVKIKPYIYNNSDSD